VTPAAARRDRRAERGVILFTAVLILAVTLGVAAVLVTLSLDDRLIAQHDFEAPVALAAAEGATQVGTKAILTAVANYQPVPTTGVATLNGHDYAYTIALAGPPSTRTDAQGVTTNYQHYMVNAVVTVDHARSSVRRLVQVGRSPVFQYAIFYNSELHVAPGAPMTISGRVHTNRDLYVGGTGGVQFQTNSVRAAGSVFRAASGAGAGGVITALVNGTTSTYASWPTTLTSASPTFARDAQATFDGTLETGATGVTEIVAPAPRSIADGGYYATNAGLVVKDGQAFLPGSTTPLAVSTGAIVEKTLYDARQRATVKVTEIDVGLLAPNLPANGLVYASRSDTTVAAPNGIRLKDAATLPAGGLTVVSPDPVYVQGDFNTVSKQPAAVIADALNLLSNAWDDSKTAGTLPDATATTYIVSFVAGNTTGSPGVYAGGVENFPRFHESWTGVTCKITGSIANFWPSAYATAPWVYGGDVYTAPNRSWSFDASLSGALPPFAPVSVSVTQNVLTVDR
jgi:hypothetical protein